MENYKEKVTVYKGRPYEKEEERLQVIKLPSGYGYRLYDAKLRKNLLFAKSEETCNFGRSYLEEEDMFEFESLKNMAELEVIETRNILVHYDKHGTWYYDVSTLEDLYKVSLHMLKELWESGWLQKWDEPEPLDFTEEDIKTMPESFRKEAEEKLKNYKSELEGVLENNREYEKVQKILETGNGGGAYRIISSRSSNGHEYEQIEIITPMKID